jgi:hypothetical protein
MSYVYYKEDKNNQSETVLGKAEAVRQIAVQLNIKSVEARKLLETTIDTKKLVNTPYSSFYAIKKSTLKYKF